jgi:hypothetical protein
VAGDDREEVTWELVDGGDLERIVLYGYGSFNCLPRGPVFLNVDDPSATSGTVTVECSAGDYVGDGKVGSIDSQKPSCPCPGPGEEAEGGVRFEIADDGTIEAGEDACGGPPQDRPRAGCDDSFRLRTTPQERQ